MITSESNAVNTQRDLRRTGRWYDVLGLTVLMVGIYLLIANHPPLGSATRYYEAAREMVETGDWVVPQLAYAPYVEKPPMVYWAGAACRGISEHPFMTSLPSLMASLLSVLVIYLFGCQWRNRMVGLTAAGLLLGATFSQVMSSVLTTDPLLAGLLTLATYCWWIWDTGGQFRSRWLYGFYFLIALGWLTKGPIALALPAAGIALFAFLRGGVTSILSTLIRMRPWWGIFIIIAVNAPWTYVLFERDPRLVEFFYVHINYDAFVHGTYNHPGAWWYYAPIILACLAPYSLILVPLIGQTLWRCARSLRWLKDGFRTTIATDVTQLFLGCMICGPLLLLTISSSKLATYLLPLSPFLLLLAADAMNVWSKPPRWVIIVVTFQAVIIALAVSLIPIVLIAIHESLEQGHALILFGLTLAKEPQLQDIDWSYSSHLVAAGGCLLLAAIASVITIMRDQLRWSLASLAIGVTAVLALLLPTFDNLSPKHDITSLAKIIIRQRQSADASTPQSGDLILVHDSAVHDYELLLTLKHRVGIYGSARETGVGHFVQAHPDTTPLPGPGQPINHAYDVSGTNTTHPWLWSDKLLIADWTSPRRVWLVADATLADELKRLKLTFFIIDRARRKALFCNQP
jgi:4-amino-4-deoxy-L-arabinose transferase-like glycosyltransferase